MREPSFQRFLQERASDMRARGERVDLSGLAEADSSFFYRGSPCQCGADLCFAAPVGPAGCQPLALSLLGAGAGTAFRYSIDGVTSRTFTAPAVEVKHASLAALERMGIAFESLDKFEYGELIYARAENRFIEIEKIEPISPRATRMRIAAKNGGLLYDNATAREIVAQTERSLSTASTGSTGTTGARGATASSF